jgi:hypothetical protein
VVTKNGLNVIVSRMKIVLPATTNLYGLRWRTTMSKLPRRKEGIVEYAETLFAYLKTLGWESPDAKRIAELKAKLAELQTDIHYLYDNWHSFDDPFAQLIDIAEIDYE